MNSRALCKLACRLMRHPAVPYHEHAVRAEVETICRENGLQCEQDQFGNLLIRLLTSRKLRPTVFAAHMDHPGFELLNSSSNRQFPLAFRGGVPEQYFHPGLAVRLMPGGEKVKLGRRVGKDRVFEVCAASSDSRADFAVWDVEDFKVRQGRIHGRACDDLIGVASALAALIELKKSRARVNVIGAISRAEEIGFHGALALSRSPRLAKNSFVVSLETSRELPGVKMGKGVILRVGDRTSVFDSKAMRFLGEVASGLRAKRRGFEFQRALMSGGTCEATAYQEYGFQTGAVCVALGNYHNCAPGHRIAAEYVNILDACSMVDLLVETAKNMTKYHKIVQKLPKRLEQMRKDAVRCLRATP